MKALSLWQPWASLWERGFKIHETRHWFLSHRGVLAVHAARKKPSSLGLDPAFTRQVRRQLGVGALDSLPLGGIVGVVEVTGCYRTEDQELTATPMDKLLGDWSPGRFCIRAEKPCPLPTMVPLRGMQGLWELDPSIALEIARQLAASVVPA